MGTEQENFDKLVGLLEGENPQGSKAEVLALLAQDYSDENAINVYSLAHTKGFKAGIVHAARRSIEQSGFLQAFLTHASSSADTCKALTYCLLEARSEAVPSVFSIHASRLYSLCSKLPSQEWLKAIVHEQAITIWMKKRSLAVSEELSIPKSESLNFIDEGAYAKVYQYLDGDANIAVKKSHAEDVEGTIVLLEEIYRIKSAQLGDYAVNLQGFLLQQDSGSLSVCMFMDYIPGGTVKEAIYNNTPLSDEQALHILQKTAMGLNFLHRKGIVHRDLKPENILLRDNVTRDPVLADFGTAGDLDEIIGLGKNLTTVSYACIQTLLADLTIRNDISPGTLRWYQSLIRAPDTQIHPDEEFKVRTEWDVYSLGMIAWEMMCKNGYPYRDVKVTVVNSSGYNVRRLANADAAYMVYYYTSGGPPLPEPAQFGPDCQELVTCMWDHNWRNRPNMETVAEKLSKIKNNPQRNHPNMETVADELSNIKNNPQRNHVSPAVGQPTLSAYRSSPPSPPSPPESGSPPVQRRPRTQRSRKCEFM